MKVYVIMKGEYSDKHICGAAIDPDVAEIIRQKCSDPDPEYDYGHARIEEYDTERWSVIAQGGKIFRVVFRPDGEIRCREAEFSHWDYATYEDYKHCFKAYDGLCVYVTATNAAQAKKIACDKRAEYLAMEEGI